MLNPVLIKAGFSFVYGLSQCIRGIFVSLYSAQYSVMAIHSIDTETFVSLRTQYPLADVRSPAEYAHAHIPAAFSLPLFSDEERRVVGTTYKQQSREAAIKTGLDYFGPKMRMLLEQAEAALEQAGRKQILLHCWRGGMRSAAVAWLLDMYGFDVYLLQGGYKAFRHWVLNRFNQPLPFAVLGGYTGSAKTRIIAQLAAAGQTVIDLEALAGHKGSAFGKLGLPPQPGTEQMENKLALALLQAEQERAAKGTTCIWLEDESRRIGDINLPEAFFAQLRAAPFVFLEVPFEERLRNILEDYGRFSVQELSGPIERIRRRLGDEEARNALRLLQEGNTEACFRILLRYYDKYYRGSSLDKTRPVQYLNSEGMDTGTLLAELKKQSSIWTR